MEDENLETERNNLRKTPLV